MGDLSNSHEEVLRLAAKLARAKVEIEYLKGKIDEMQDMAAHPPVPVSNSNAALARLVKYQSLKFWNDFYTDASLSAQQSYNDFIEEYGGVPSEAAGEVVFHLSSSTFNSLPFLGTSQKQYLRGALRNCRASAFTPLVDAVKFDASGQARYAQFWFSDFRTSEAGREAVSVILSLEYPDTEELYQWGECDGSIYDPEFYILQLPKPICFEVGVFKSPLIVRHMTICRAWFDHE